MKYRYYTCDVFTETRFGGNPLAVLPQADGLSAHQMQQIAREFNYSESAFVLPLESRSHAARANLYPDQRGAVCRSSKRGNRIRSCQRRESSVRYAPR